MQIMNDKNNAGIIPADTGTTTIPMNNEPFTSTTTTADSKNKNKRKHVSFVEPPPPAEERTDAAAESNALKDELIALKREFEHPLRMEQCAIDLSQRLFGS